MKETSSGGVKGFLQRTGKFFYSGGVWAYDACKVGYIYGGKFAFALATTSMLVLMPLLFEIAREGHVRYHKYYFYTEKSGIVVNFS